MKVPYPANTLTPDSLRIVFLTNFRIISYQSVHIIPKTEFDDI